MKMPERAIIFGIVSGARHLLTSSVRIRKAYGIAREHRKSPKYVTKIFEELAKDAACVLGISYEY